MRIVFICGSLEPGRDGVGDYTSIIALKLAEQGNEILAVSLNDEYVKALDYSEKVITQGSLKTLRLPALMGVKEKYKILKGYLQTFNAGWISLQYVGFSYSRYGLPFSLMFYLPRITGNTKLQVMLHELWCGMDSHAGVKEKLLGFLQKLFLKVLLIRLKPDKVFTSIDYYRNCLKGIHIKAELAPIFGNIPLNETGSEGEWDELRAKANLDPLVLNRNSWLSVVFFGTIYDNPGTGGLINLLSEAAKQLKLKLGIISVGHNRLIKAEDIAPQLNDITYWFVGATSAAMINEVLGLVDLGILTSPANRINKSGSGKSLLEHGIPLLVAANDITYDKQTMQKQGIFQLNNADQVPAVLSAKLTMQKGSTIDTVAEMYDFNRQ